MDNFEHWGGSFFLKTGGISTYFLILSIYLNCQDTMILVFLWKFILCISGIMPQFLQVSLTLVFLSNKWYSSGSLPGDQCQLLVEIYIGDRILCIKASYKIANDSHEKKNPKLYYLLFYRQYAFSLQNKASFNTLHFGNLIRNL